MSYIATGTVNDGDTLSVNLQTSEVIDQTTGNKIEVEPFSGVQLEIYQRGGLLCKANACQC